MENTGAVSLPQSEYEEWIENGCKKAAEIIRESEKEQSQDEFLAEHEYKMEHDHEYRKSIEKTAAFFKADKEAEEKAGLKNKLGSYTFTCPNCGSECKGVWVRFDEFGNRHGRTDCQICNIHLMV